MWPCFACVASLQGKGVSKQTAEELQLERGGSRLLTETLRTVNNGSGDAQDFGSATDARCSSERPLLSYVYISALSIFTPHGGTQVSNPFVLRRQRSSLHRRGTVTGLWMVGETVPLIFKALMSVLLM